jgi:hypothetical protein
MGTIELNANTYFQKNSLYKLKVFRTEFFLLEPKRKMIILEIGQAGIQIGQSLFQLLEEEC